MEAIDRDAEAARVGAAWRELRRVASMGELRYRFRDTSAGLLELAQADALFALVASNGRRMSDMGDALRVDKSTATRAIQRLVDAGLAERQADPCDKRGVIVVATDKGRAVHAELVANARSGLHELLTDFDDRDLVRLAALMERFVGAVDAMVARERAWRLDGSPEPE